MSDNINYWLKTTLVLNWISVFKISFTYDNRCTERCIIQTGLISRIAIKPFTALYIIDFIIVLWQQN